MGTSRSGAELAGKFVQLAVDLPNADRDAVNRSAMAGKQIMLQGAVKAGLRAGGALPAHGTSRWGARYDIRGGRNPTALLRYVGPVHWAFYGTTPHVIGARRRGTRRAFQRRYAGSMSEALSGKRGRGRTLTSGRYGARDGKGALALRFGGRFATYALHPGAKGRNTWPDTRRRIMEVAPREFQKSHRAAIVKAFR